MKLFKDDIFKDTDTFFRFLDGKDLFKDMHDHDYYEIFIVIKGSVTHICNNTTEIYIKNEAFFIYPEDNHVLKGDENSEILNIAFSCSLFNQMKELLCADSITKKAKISAENVYFIQSKIRTLISNYNSQRSEVAIKSLLVLLMQEFFTERSDIPSQLPEWFQNFLTQLEIVDVFTGNMVTIYTLTNKTPEHISRTFRKYMNTTLTAYLLNLKIHYASRLLTTTSIPIIDICYETGFNNLGYFYRCFKKSFGSSPKKYRDLHSIKI